MKRASTAADHALALELRARDVTVRRLAIPRHGPLLGPQRAHDEFWRREERLAGIYDDGQDELDRRSNDEVERIVFAEQERDAAEVRSLWPEL